MPETIKLRLTGRQHEHLQNILLADGKEAVAICLCGQRKGIDSHCISIYEINAPESDDYLQRRSDLVNWKTDFVVPLLEKANRRGLSILKIHSHPQGSCFFSGTDDRSDKEFFPSVFGWTDDPATVHLSAVMDKDGHIIARSVSNEGEFSPVSLVSVAGDELQFWWSTDDEAAATDMTRRNAQAFGQGTVNLLRKLSVAVIGCSGTGSVVVEQLARLGVGKITLVDPDRIERKNLNRILNATSEDAEAEKLKVDVLASAIQKIGFGSSVRTLSCYLGDAVECVAECDVAFGCVDTAEGRHMLNRLAVFYCLPYFDVGVRLDADGSGGIDQICGTVHYLQPGGSSLLSRGAITMDQIRAENIRRSSPDEYERLKSEKVHHRRERRSTGGDKRQHAVCCLVSQ